MQNGPQDHPLNEWFGIAAKALRTEDTFLRDHLCAFATGAYVKWNCGIVGLYETGIAYVMLRALWAARFPWAVTWEFPYPDMGNAKLDLAVYDKRPDECVADCCPAFVIEVKKKYVGHGTDQCILIWWDLLRLLWFEKAKHRYLLLLTYGKKGCDLRQDVDDLLNRRLGRGGVALSLEQLIEKVISKETQYRPYYLQHFGGVQETLSDEFDTDVAWGDRCGRVRVSLIEIFRRT